MKSEQTSALLLSDIRDAHRIACYENPVLEILLRDLLASAVTLNDRLASLSTALKA